MPVKKVKTKKTADEIETPKIAVYFEAVGRRKTSVARVRFFPAKGGSLPTGQAGASGGEKGQGKIEVNGKELKDYFPVAELQYAVKLPLEKTGVGKNFNITAKIYGGGISSQAQALRHGISRVLIKYNVEFRKILKPEGLLTRDDRMKERRKFGLKKARKAPQWSKR